jgi:hypothetical protein
MGVTRPCCIETRTGEKNVRSVGNDGRTEGSGRIVEIRNVSGVIIMIAAVVCRVDTLISEVSWPMVKSGGKKR